MHKDILIAIESTEGVDGVMGGFRYRCNLNIGCLFTTEEVISNLKNTLRKIVSNDYRADFDDLKEKTMEELNYLLNDSLIKEDYELASRIKSEMDSRRQE